MTIQTFLSQLYDKHEAVEFNDLMQLIADHYEYTPTRFTNGDVVNEAGSNEGSCKLFAFARLHKLNEAQTLACFGQYYREDVLQHPDASDHANIRQFMQMGWAGINFDEEPLKAL